VDLQHVAQQLLPDGHHIENAHPGQTSKQELSRLLEQVARQRLQQAVSHEKLILASYEEEKRKAIELDQAMTKLDILKLDLNRLRGSYDTLLQQIKDVNLSQENAAIKTSILSQPEVVLTPVLPKKRLVALLSIMIGLGAGLGIVYVQDLLADRFRSPEELRMQTGLPVLAAVSRLKQLEDNGIDSVHTHARPNAVESEAFRSLRTALAFTEGGVRRLVVSSSEPGDGKTTIVVNLAVVYAQLGKRTLLIDADMRRPRLMRLFNLGGEHGLVAVLGGSAAVVETVEANLYCSVIENLDVLPSGPRPANPTELLAGDRFCELLSWAETQYDHILIDSPSALVSDATIIGRLVDGVLLTVDLNRDRRRVVIRAAEGLAALGIKVLGAVVNRTTRQHGKDGYGCGYDYECGYGYGYEDDSPGGNEEIEWPGRPFSRIVRRTA